MFMWCEGVWRYLLVDMNERIVTLFYVAMENETTKDITAKVHIGHAIQEEMTRQGRNVTWLAAQIHMTDRAIYKIYDKESLNTELVRLISNAMGKNFFALYDISEQNGEK